MPKRRILFVDDQPNVLEGLRRMLHGMRNEWDMEFASSGQAALDMMRDRPFDLVVADMMMPQINGAQLLKKVSELHPGTVRFILSGHSNRELILQSVGFAHQYLAKPCDPETLKSALTSSLRLRSVLTGAELHSKIAQIGSLPSPPQIHNRLVAELQSDTASIRKIADLVSKDVSLTAKLLQMVNSAFFGLPAHVDSPAQAVNLLGLDNVYGIVTAAGVFDQFECAPLEDISVDGIYAHSIAVGSSARDIARYFRLSSHDVDHALIAGMLHDIGKLIMITHFRDDMAGALRLAKEKSMQLHRAETEILGVSHAEIGAHLLSLWGLPDPVLEAVALHHRPDTARERVVTPLTAVHMANAVHRAATFVPIENNDTLLHEEYLKEVGLSDRIRETGYQLLRRIPRLEVVSDMIRGQQKAWKDCVSSSDSLPDDPGVLGGLLLKAAIDFDRLILQGCSKAQAVGKLRSQRGIYHPAILDVFHRVELIQMEMETKVLRIRDLNDRMVLAEDVRSNNGMLIAPQGQQVHLSMRRLLENYLLRNQVNEEIRVRVPVAKASKREASRRQRISRCRGTTGNQDQSGEPYGCCGFHRRGEQPGHRIEYPNRWSAEHKAVGGGKGASVRAGLTNQPS